MAFIVKAHGVGREKCHQVAQSSNFYYKHVYPSPLIVSSTFYPREQHKLPQVFTVAQIQQLLGDYQSKTPHDSKSILWHGHVASS